MNLEQRLRASLVAPDPGTVFTARVMARVARGGGQRGRRLFVVGVVLVGAVAAAMLAWQANGSRAPAIEPALMPASSESPAVSASGVRQEDPVHSAPISAQDQVAAAGPAAIRIVLMPAQHNSQDITAKPAIDAFHSSLLQALRSQPDVVVEVAGAGAAGGQPANRVTVVSPRYTTLPSGRRLYQSGDGRGNWQGVDGTTRGPPQWPVEVMLNLAELGTLDGLSMLEQSVEVHQAIDGIGILTGQSCEYSSTLAGGAPPPASSNGVPALCSSVEGLAAWLVATLRPQPAPPVVETAQLISRLSDASTPDRPGTFRELLNRARFDGSMLDAAAIKAIAAYLAGIPTPEQRFSSMLALRFMRQPGLVAPLLEILERDGDEKVRLEALSMLIAEYGGDGRVRAALENVARQDASTLVRMVAQRPLYGDAPWRTYVVNTLTDRTLSAANRLAPAQYEMQEQAYASGGRKVPSWLGSEQVTRQLIDMFQELRARVHQQGTEPPPGLPPDFAERMAELGIPPEGSVVQMVAADGSVSSGRANGSGAVRQDGALQSVLSLLSITNPAAATDRRISVLTESPAPPTWLAMNSLKALVEKRDDPRVSKVLDDIAAGKSGPELRSMLERSMTMRPQTSSSTVR